MKIRSLVAKRSSISKNPAGFLEGYFTNITRHAAVKVSPETPIT